MKKPEMPPLEEIGNEVHKLISDDGFTLQEAAKHLAEKYQRTPNVIRWYWSSYAQFHRIEYNRKLNKIQAYDEIS